MNALTSCSGCECIRARNKSVMRGKQLPLIKRLSVTEYLSYLLTKKNIKGSAIAVIGEEKKLTFDELEDYSTRLAKVIRYFLGTWTSNNPDGDLVIAFCMNTSEKVIVLILAIMKLGATFLPLLPSYPEQHIIRLIGATRPILILIDSTPPIVTRYQAVKNLTTVTVFDKMYDIVERKVFSDDLNEVTPLKSLVKTCHRAAAIYFTAGTTGFPQGVRISHQALLNRIAWQLSELPYRRSERGYLTCSIVDVECIPEILAPLIAGIPVVVFNQHITNNPQNFLQKLTDTKVTRITASPTLLLKMLNYIEKLEDPNRQKNLLPDLQHWSVVGDLFPKELGEKFFTIFPTHKDLTLFYGTTEVLSETCFEIFHDMKEFLGKCDPIKNSVSLGVPISNTKIYVFDEDMKLAKLGSVGEICVLGTPLCLGYVTGSRANTGVYSGNFARNPLSKTKDCQFFRTGDYGRIIADSKGRRRLYYDGRADELIKVSGKTVKLRDISAAVRNTDCVQECEVLCYRPDKEDQVIVAACILKEGVEPVDITQMLNKTLPNILLPEIFEVQELPRFQNGRLNKQKVLRTYEAHRMEVSADDWKKWNLNPDEKYAAKVLCEGIAVGTGLSMRYVVSSLDHSFWSIGGSSLNVVSAVHYAREHGYSITIDEFVSGETLLDIMRSMLASKKKPKLDVNSCSLAKSKFFLEDLTPSHHDVALRILTEAYTTKSDMILNLHCPMEDFSKYVELMWKGFLAENQSIVAVSRETKEVVGICMNTDANRGPSPTLNTRKPLPSTILHVMDLYKVAETTVREKTLSRGVGKTMQTVLIGTDHSVKPGDNVLLVQLLLKASSEKALSLGYSSVMMTTSHTLGKQLCGQLLRYNILKEYQINRFVGRDGTKPFHLAADYYTMRTYFQNIF